MVTFPTYATEADIYSYALPRGSLGNPGRLVDSALAATSTVTLSEHGFATGQAISFRANAGGALPSPLVAGTTYYAIYLTDSTFQVSATPNGAPITLTTDGTSVIVVADLPFAAVLAYYSRWVESFLPAHAVPLTAPYPILIVGLIATLAAKRIQIISGVRSGSMDEDELAAKAQLERFAAGLPSREAQANNVVPTNTAVAVTPPMLPTPTVVTVTSLSIPMAPPSASDPRGWAVNGSGNIP